MVRTFDRSGYYKARAQKELAQSRTPAKATREGTVVTITRGTSPLPAWKRGNEALQCSAALAEQLKVGETMKTTAANISLSQLHRQHRIEVQSMAEDASPLDPEWNQYPPIVRPTENGLTVVDGFSRLAGMVAHGAEEFPVIIVEGADDLCKEIDCGSVIGQCEPLDAIYDHFFGETDR